MHGPWARARCAPPRAVCALVADRTGSAVAADLAAATEVANTVAATAAATVATAAATAAAAVSVDSATSSGRVYMQS